MADATYATAEAEWKAIDALPAALQGVGRSRANGDMKKKERKQQEEPGLVSGGKGEIVIYQPAEGGGRLEVRLEDQTLWLSLNQIAAVFERDKSVISRHLRNVFRDGELDRESVVAFFATTAADGKTYHVEHFNLDAILSVGYRVNSVRGTQFRIWATGVLRDHLVQGYSVNAKRLKELRQSLKLVGQVLERYDVTSDQARGLLQVVTDYSSALDLLDDYDHQRVSVGTLKPRPAKGIDYEEAMAIVGELRRKFGGSELFGKEKDQSLRGSLGAVMPYRRQRPGRHHADDRGKRPGPEGHSDPRGRESHPGQGLTDGRTEERQRKRPALNGGRRAEDSGGKRR